MTRTRRRGITRKNSSYGECRRGRQRRTRAPHPAAPASQPWSSTVEVSICVAYAIVVPGHMQSAIRPRGTEWHRSCIACPLKCTMTPASRFSHTRIHACTRTNVHTVNARACACRKSSRSASLDRDQWGNRHLQSRCVGVGVGASLMHHGKHSWTSWYRCLLWRRPMVGPLAVKRWWGNKDFLGGAAYLGVSAAGQNRHLYKAVDGRPNHRTPP